MNQMTEPCAAVPGDRVAYDLAPGVVMTVGEARPCEQENGRYGPHSQYRVSITHWICAFDVHKVPALRFPPEPERTRWPMKGMTEPCTAEPGDRIAHDLMPGFAMTVKEARPCERDTNRHLAHFQYRITDPEGQTDWLCAFDVHKAPVS